MIRGAINTKGVIKLSIYRIVHKCWFIPVVFIVNTHFFWGCVVRSVFFDFFFLSLSVLFSFIFLTGLFVLLCLFLVTFLWRLGIRLFKLRSWRLFSTCATWIAIINWRSIWLGMKALFLFAFTITRRVVFRRHCLLLLLIILSGSSLPRTLLLLLLLPFLSWYLLRLLLPFLFCLLL